MRKRNPHFDPAALPEVFASTTETTRAVRRRDQELVALLSFDDLRAARAALAACNAFEMPEDDVNVRLPPVRSAGPG